MSEYEPSFGLTYNGEKLACTRENTTLYTFMGHLALYNHVFTVLPNNPETDAPQGLYVFQQVLPENYEKIEEFMVSHNYPQIINMHQVPEIDQESLHKILNKDIDTTPDWMPEV